MNHDRNRGTYIPSTRIAVLSQARTNLSDSTDHSNQRDRGLDLDKQLTGKAQSAPVETRSLFGDASLKT